MTNESARQQAIKVLAKIYEDDGMNAVDQRSNLMLALVMLWEAGEDKLAQWVEDILSLGDEVERWMAVLYVLAIVAKVDGYQREYQTEMENGLSVMVLGSALQNMLGS